MCRIQSEADLVQALTGNPGCNITYVLDVSERTREVLGSVKRLLIKTLLAKASLGDSLFNIITSSNTVHCWSQGMVSCLPDKVFEALPWVHAISCCPGRDVLSGLKAALSDPACHAVHLLCADLPERPELLLRSLPAPAECRPISAFHLRGSKGQLERTTRDHLLCLSEATRGSCYLIMLDLHGGLDKVIPLRVAESQQPSLPASQANRCSHATSAIKSQPTPPAHWLECPGSGVQCSASTARSEFLPGCRVLARRAVDGLYYQSTLIQQVQGIRGVWVVEFDHHGSGVPSLRQPVCSLDLVVGSRAPDHRLGPGDFVLSPWESDLRRYGPGRVVAVAPQRGRPGDVVTSVQVLMWNDCLSLAPDSLVVPISLYRYYRLVRQLQTPAPAPGRCCSCSCICTRSPWSLQRSFTGCCCQSTYTPHCCSAATQQACVAPRSCRSRLEEPCDFNRVDSNQQVDLRDELVWNGDSEATSPPASSPSVVLKEGSIAPKVRLGNKRQRLPWRYWRRAGPEPWHKQPGSEKQRSASQRSSLPVSQIRTSPNHSSVFHSLPEAEARKACIGDVFGMSSFKPQPPPRRQSFSAGRAEKAAT